MRVLNYTIHIGKMTGKRKWVLFGVSILFGAGIWLLTPYITGEEEAFDAPNYYRGTLVFCSAILGILEARGFWLWPLGITIGQLAVYLTIMNSSLLKIEVLFIVIATTIVSFAASVIGAVIVLVVTHLKAPSVPNGAENGR